MAALATASFWNWITDAWVAQYSAKRLADINSKEIKLAEQLARLTPEQLDLFRQLSRASMDDSDLDALVIDGIPIPDEFLRELISGSRGAHLIPERTYSEGSKERLWYKTLVQYWDSQGLIVRAAGNRAAQVTDWNRAIELISQES